MFGMCGTVMDLYSTKNEFFSIFFDTRVLKWVLEAKAEVRVFVQNLTLTLQYTALQYLVSTRLYVFVHFKFIGL